MHCDLKLATRALDIMEKQLYALVYYMIVDLEWKLLQFSTETTTPHATAQLSISIRKNNN